MVAECVRPWDVREALSLAMEARWQALTCADEVLGANGEETVPTDVDEKGSQAQGDGAHGKEERVYSMRPVNGNITARAAGQQRVSQDMLDLILLAQHLLLPLSPAVDVAELLQQPFAVRAVRLLVRTSLLSSQRVAPALRAAHMWRTGTGVDGRGWAPGLCFDGQSKVPVAVVCAQQACGALRHLRGELGAGMLHWNDANASCCSQGTGDDVGGVGAFPHPTPSTTSPGGPCCDISVA
jgi:hypothetical protein